jgi:hypothetical protein
MSSRPAGVGREADRIVRCDEIRARPETKSKPPAA